MKKNPEQTAKTRQRIIDAFWELAASQGIDKVSISAIAKKASVNRGTFYVYFADINDLLEQAETEIITDLRQRWQIAFLEGGFENFEIVSRRIFDVFTLYDDKIFLLTGSRGDPHFRQLVQDEATKLFTDALSPICNVKNSEYVIAYLSSAFMGLLNFWHEKGKQISILELAQIIHTILTKGVFGIIGQKTDPTPS